MADVACAEADSLSPEPHRALACTSFSYAPAVSRAGRGAEPGTRRGDRTVVIEPVSAPPTDRQVNALLTRRRSLRRAPGRPVPPAGPTRPADKIGIAYV